ncbi:hypothetical protein [Acidisoma sp. S159]|uniref:hypothetical protein n=1 Tax=Acidisoma sp. S159 TaxID=1747225 RepID=UPI00131B5820|nr:hypothetical protein [Acidisoma sp. S159]
MGGALVIGALHRAYASFRGFDTTGTAVPAMDGPLTPNTQLDQAPILGRFPRLDNLLTTPDGLIGSQGSEIVSLAAGDLGWTSRIIRTCPKPVSFLAVGPSGVLAVGQDGGGVLLVGGRHDGRMLIEVEGERLNCPTAGAFLGADTLILANGSAMLPAAEWKRDLMTKGASGKLWRIPLTDSGKPIALASGLCFPSGVVLGADSAVFVSEAWRHRVVMLQAARATPIVTALGKLPAYPGRILAAQGGGFWLAMFAPRNQLVEFVLKETAYRDRMIDTIDTDLWIAPALFSGVTFLEPIQGGARKKLNTLKPWSPSWSYGLVVRCDERMRPIASYHSRADGRVHGVTSLAEHGDTLMVGAQGSGVLVGLPRDPLLSGYPA